MRIRQLLNAPLLLVAAGGLVVGLAGPAFGHEARHLISGASIKPHTIAGNRLKKNTVTGSQIKESTLGTVPQAKLATTAATAEALPPLTWNALTLENGWSDFGGFGEPAASYAVDAQGVVYFRGVIHGGSGAAFTLPTSVYNFNDSIYLPAMVGDGPTSGLLMILDGTAYPKDGSSASGSATTLTSLGGLSFAAY